MDCPNNLGTPTYVDVAAGQFSGGNDAVYTRISATMINTYSYEDTCSASNAVIFADYKHVCHICPPGWDCNQGGSFDPYDNPG